MNDATQRRAQRARASDLALAPPASTVYPPTLVQLLQGWPLVWNNVYRDTAAWVGGLSRKGLPDAVKAALDAVIQADLTLPALQALIETCDAVVRQGGLPVDVLDAVREIAARHRSRRCGSATTRRPVASCIWPTSLPSRRSTTPADGRSR